MVDEIGVVSTPDAAPHQTPAANGRRLAPPWKPGQSGNPGGWAGPVREAQKIARENTPAAMRKLVELMDSRDERVVAVAANAILDRAMGKPKEAVPERGRGPALDLSRLTTVQLAVLRQIVVETEPAEGVPQIEGENDGEDRGER